MAKKKDQSFSGDSPFRKTEAEPEAQTIHAKTGTIEGKTQGIYFSSQEVERIKSVMKATGENSFYKIVKYALTYFLNKFEAGEIETETKTQTKLKLD